MLNCSIDILRGVAHKFPGYKLVRWVIFRKRPKAINGKVLLHIGCGRIDRPYFINIDTAFYPHLHYRKNISSRRLWKASSVDLIYVSHVLEHVKRDEINQVLANLYKALRPGGVLRISVPNFDSIVEAYSLSLQDVNAVAQFLMGGQNSRYNFHFHIYNKAHLENLLAAAGFKEVSSWNPDEVEYHDFDDWANFNISVADQLIPLSLNLEAIK